MTTSICQYCNKEISKQNMRKHQKTQTCKKFQVPVLSDFDKEVMRLCEENERIYNSDYESDSDKSSEPECGLLGYDMLDTGGILALKKKVIELGFGFLEICDSEEEEEICPHCKRNEDECEKNAEWEKNPITYWMCGWGLSCDDCYYLNHPEEDEDEDE